MENTSKTVSSELVEFPANETDFTAVHVDKQDCDPPTCVPDNLQRDNNEPDNRSHEPKDSNVPTNMESQVDGDEDTLLTYDCASSKSTTVSEIEDGQIVESSSSECSDFHPSRSNLKRRSSLSEDDIGSTAGKKAKKKITFSAVTAYYFPRAQGFTCVPSQGGSTLGMSLKHSHVENLSISEHAAQQRKNHRRLLRQLRKRRRNRASKSKSQNCSDSNVAGNSEVKEKIKKESDSDESDDQWSSDVSDAELDIDNYYFLQPVPTRQRRALLREAGISKIETAEKDDCRQIRVSRESCGCTCQVYCEPESCSCAQSGIQCQVDRLNFPCGCSRDACGNPSGRVEFNPARVRTHFIHTLMRLELENGDLSNNDRQHSDLTTVDGVSPESNKSCTSLPGTLANLDPQYNWESNIQLPPPVQQPHTVYGMSESNTTQPDDASWSVYNDYSTESVFYPVAYSGITSSTGVFSFEQNHYHHDGRVTYSEVASNVQQYTQLVENGPGYPSEYYPESSAYNGFDEASYNYNFSHNANFTEQVYGTGPGESFNYMDGVESIPEIDSINTDNRIANCVPSASPSSTPCFVNDVNEFVASNGETSKAESSSSSEEDALDISSSLATIVKETMVSV